ncbi:nucleotide exchange factor GrpE, partial [bacterium]|nr:nucleotide exchange factor GrpE [bacterium]
VHLIYDERPVYFNDKYDEAILSKDCDDKNLDNSIDTVYQKGYIFKDKILRYEKVIVNKYKE